MVKITVKEVPIEEAVKVNSTIVEFDEPYSKEYFEESNFPHAIDVIDLTP